jgi:predicted component of type VI protein secretion system
MYTSVTCTPFILSSHVNLYLSFFQLIPTLRVLINASNSFDLDAPEARKTLVVLVCHLAILRANKQKLELDRQRSLLLKAPAKSPSSRKDTRASARSFVGSPDGVSSLCNPQSFF